MPLFAATRKRALSLTVWFLALAFLLPVAGCVKKTIKVSPQPGLVNDKRAGFDELLKLLRSYDRIEALSSNNLDLTFTSSKKRDAGVLEKYKTLDGYVLLKRPESIRLVLQMPITNSRLIDFVSVGDNFSVDYPRENKFYRGKNSARELVSTDPAQPTQFNIPLRGTHIFEAIFPHSLKFDAPGTWISMEEQADERARYYVLSVSREGRNPRMHLVRKIWIERSGLTIARQQVFSEEGQVVSDIKYSEETKVDGFSLPLKIHVDRPVDGYMLDLEFKNWNVNREDLTDEAFLIQPSNDASIIELREKGGGDALR